MLDHLGQLYFWNRHNNSRMCVMLDGWYRGLVLCLWVFHSLPDSFSSPRNHHKVYLSLIFICNFLVIIIYRAQVAEYIKEGSEAFIFGINTLFAVVIHFALTFSVVGRYGFRLAIRAQHLVYAAYAVILGVMFVVLAVTVSIRKRCPNRRSLSNRSKVSTEAVGKTELEKEQKSIDLEIGPNVNSMEYSLPREN